jgi:replicative DNA helicase
LERLELLVQLQDPGAELAIIGGCLSDKANLLKAMDRLTPEDFYLETRRLIFQGIVEVFNRDKTLDITSLYSWLKDHADADLVTVARDEVLRSMKADEVFWNFDRHIETVKQKSVARKFLRSVGEAEARLSDGEPPVEIICQAMERGSALLAEADRSQAERIGEIALRMGDEFDERYKTRGALPGISSGIPRLDRLTCGWSKRQPYIIIAARPSVGKTTFALNLGFSAAWAGYKVRFHSVEMDKESISEMAISLVGGIENLRLRTGNLGDEDLERIGTASGRLQDANLTIDDTPEITVQQIRTRTQRQIMDGGCDLVIIDYLQIIRGGGRFSNKREEVTEISRQLKSMGRALRIPMIVLCQLNRETEQTGAKKVIRPSIANLRESGAIEQDADVIGLLWDPAAKENAEEGTRPPSSVISLYVAKNRRGLTGNVDLRFDRNLCRFTGV